MDLFSREWNLLHSRLLMRFGAALMVVSLMFSLIVQPPKAKAVAPLAGAALGASMIYSYMQSAGITMGVTGATAGDLADAISPYIGQFEAKLKEDIGDAGLTFSKWLGYDDWDGLVSDLKYQRDAQDGLKYKIFVPKAMSAKLAEFTKWFAGKLGLSAGTKDVEYYHAAGGQYIPLADGGKIVLTETIDADNDVMTALGTVVATMSSGDEAIDFSYKLANGKTFRLWSNGGTYRNYLYASYGNYSDTSRTKVLSFDGEYSIDKIALYAKDSTAEFGYAGDICPVFHLIDSDKWSFSLNSWLYSFSLQSVQAVSEPATDISVSQADELAPAVDTSEKELPTVITVPGIGAEITDIADLLKEILDKIAANDLTAEGTIAAEEVVEPEPEEPDEVTDVDGLGLPALGAALVTRFPFSIPWDVVKGIKLIAAPAKAPYWEVDFLSPIASRVGGWKGATKVVIDMGEYPVVGQLCRWTSMIGFCLVLAAATKRLIWTA